MTSQLYWPTTTSTSTTWTTSSTSSTYLRFANSIMTVADNSAHLDPFKRELISFVARLGQNIKIELPDGSIFCLANDGVHQICDKDAKVTYRGNRVREFNRFINASDLIEEFIAFLGEKGARQGDVLGVPIEVLINWLILRAAEKDGLPAPDGLRVEDHPRLLRGPPRKPRCLTCGRFVRKRHVELGMPFCSQAHMLARSEMLGLR